MSPPLRCGPGRPWRDRPANVRLQALVQRGSSLDKDLNPLAILVIFDFDNFADQPGAHGLADLFHVKPGAFRDILGAQLEPEVQQAHRQADVHLDLAALHLGDAYAEPAARARRPALGGGPGVARVAAPPPAPEDVIGVPDATPTAAPFAIHAAAFLLHLAA